MKKFTFTIVAAIMALVLIAATNSDTNDNLHFLDGVWELQHQFIYEDNHVQDTLYNLEGYRQVKMYSRGKVMWTRYNPVDTDEWFGYGTYELKGNYLEERLEYASNAMMKIVDTVQVFRFELEIDGDHYSQVSVDPDGTRHVSENYKRIE